MVDVGDDLPHAGDRRLMGRQEVDLQPTNPLTLWFMKCGWQTKKCVSKNGRDLDSGSQRGFNLAPWRIFGQIGLSISASCTDVPVPVGGKMAIDRGPSVIMARGRMGTPFPRVQQVHAPDSSLGRDCGPADLAAGCRHRFAFGPRSRIWRCCIQELQATARQADR